MWEFKGENCRKTDDCSSVDHTKQLGSLRPGGEERPTREVRSDTARAPCGDTRTTALAPFLNV